MAMRAATVEILIEKAKFEPRVAVAVAEAMDEAMDDKARHLQLVTRSGFDAGLSAWADRLDKKFDAIDDKFEAMNGKFDGLNSRIGGLETKMEKDKGDIVKWVLLAMMTVFSMLASMLYFFMQQIRQL